MVWQTVATLCLFDSRILPHLWLGLSFSAAGAGGCYPLCLEEQAGNSYIGIPPSILLFYLYWCTIWGSLCMSLQHSFLIPGRTALIFVVSWVSCVLLITAKVFQDLLWSDPQEKLGWEANPRGAGIKCETQGGWCEKLKKVHDFLNGIRKKGETTRFFHERYTYSLSS